MKTKYFENKLNLLLSQDINFYRNRFPKFNIRTLKNVVLFGAGQMGCIYQEYFNNLGINIMAFCDNDASKVGKKLNGVKVINIKELTLYPSSMPIIITSIYNDEISNQLKILGFKNVLSHAYLSSFFSNQFPNPYWSNSIKKILKNKEKILKCFSYYEDSFSKKVFLGVLKYRLLLNRDHILKIKSDLSNEYFQKDVISLSEDEVFIDGGAYDGDTILRFLKKTDNKFNKILAFEPDSISFKKLKRNINKLRNKKIKLFDYGMGKDKSITGFINDGTLGSRIGLNSSTKIKIISLDNLLPNEKITFIKLDIEGAEVDALLGSKKILSRKKPKLAICVYHKSDDFWKIPLIIKKYNPHYKLYLRHYGDFLYDTVCYAV